MTLNSLNSIRHFIVLKFQRLRLSYETISDSNCLNRIICVLPIEIKDSQRQLSNYVEGEIFELKIKRNL